VRVKAWIGVLDLRNLHLSTQQAAQDSAQEVAARETQCRAVGAIVGDNTAACGMGVHVPDLLSLIKTGFLDY